MRNYKELIKMSKSDDLKTIMKVYSELSVINQAMPILNRYIIGMYEEAIKPKTDKQEFNQEYQEAVITYN